MDGDGIGGSVNLVTKTATSIPTISFGAVGGYTPIVNGRGLVELTGTTGQRFGASLASWWVAHMTGMVGVSTTSNLFPTWRHSPMARRWDGKTGWTFASTAIFGRAGD